MAHKTVPMFCHLGQMDLMRSDDISNVFETFIKQSMQLKGYVECDMDGEEGGKKELGELRRNGTGD